MKITEFSILVKFFEAVDKYEGKVELIVENRIRLNLKSTLCQFVSMVYLLEQTDVADVKIVADCAADSEQMMKYIIGD